MALEYTTVDGWPVAVGIVEAWRPIPGYEGRYEASATGHVRSNLTGRVLRPYTAASGHLFVALHKDRKSRSRTVHSLIAEAFIGPRPPGEEVRHRNGNPADNRAANLRYGTRSENVLDQVSHGVHNNASKTHCKNGHPLSGDNVKPRSGGGRRCVTCDRKSKASYAARHRAMVREAA